MSKKSGVITLFSVIIFCLVNLVLFTNDSCALPSVSEKFVYDLSWTGIKAGTASLEFANDGDNAKIVSIARSADWVSVFYTVEDRVESILSKDASSPYFGQPLNYRLKIREGRHRKNKEVIFDRNRHKATYYDYQNNERKEFDLPPSAFDPLSSFYYIRSLKLTVGESVYVTIFDSKKVWNVEVQILRKEKVILPLGTFNTVVVKPLMKSEGIFYRKGDILIWLTDDAKHIPVKLKTKVMVGSINANLVGGTF